MNGQQRITEAPIGRSVRLCKGDTGSKTTEKGEDI
jgi:hypothetical protein